MPLIAGNRCWLKLSQLKETLDKLIQPMVGQAHHEGFYFLPRSTWAYRTMLVERTYSVF